MFNNQSIIKSRGQKTFFLFILTLLFLLPTACGQAPASTPTPAPKPTHSATPTNTLGASPTVMLTPQPSSTPTASPTPTVFPTLPVEQAQTKFFELLANNGGCRLPCVWGITPGKTTFEEGRAILQPLSGISSRGEVFGLLTNFENNLLDGIEPVYKESAMETSADIGYLFKSDGIVNHISFRWAEHKKHFRGEIIDEYEPIYNSKFFGERFHSYMLSGVLSELGRPASIEIQTAGSQITGSGGFEIVLVYPDQGVLVHYITQMKVVGANVKGCMANAQVEMELYPSGDTDSFVKSLSKTLVWSAFVQAEPMNNSSWKPIDKATSMSLEQFYETFRQPTNKCIETPAKQWPTPEIGGDPYQTAP